jgi:hypothetical protein
MLPVMRIDYCLVSGRRGGTSRWTNPSRSLAIVTLWRRVEGVNGEEINTKNTLNPVIIHLL